MSEEPEGPDPAAGAESETESRDADAKLDAILQDPRPGLYQGLTYDEYAMIPAINFSKLRRFIHTAAHARYYMDHPPEETKALRFGHLMHAVLLEPRSVDEQFMAMPKVDRRTKAGKAAWAQAQIAAQARTIVTEEELAMCHNIRHNISQHPTARELLLGAGGANEVSVIWRDEATEVLCKSRWDRLGPIGAQGVLGDIKSSGKVASLRNWQRACYDYGYFEQAAMYLDGANALYPLPEDQRREFMWLVVEKDLPNLIRVFKADDDALEFGYQEFRRHLDAYAECLTKGEFPGWEEGFELAGLPGWAQKAFDATL